MSADLDLPGRLASVIENDRNRQFTASVLKLVGFEPPGNALNLKVLRCQDNTFFLRWDLEILGEEGTALSEQRLPIDDEVAFKLVAKHNAPWIDQKQTSR